MMPYYGFELYNIEATKGFQIKLMQIPFKSIIHTSFKRQCLQDRMWHSGQLHQLIGPVPFRIPETSNLLQANQEIALDSI